MSCSVNVCVECERGVLIFAPTVVHCSDIILPSPAMQGIHTGSSSAGTGVESGLLGASAGSLAEGGESRSPQRQASLEQRLSEVSPYNYAVISFTNIPRTLLL